MDHVRTLYKRRWIAAPIFLIVFTIGAVNSLRQTPVYQGRAQLLIERDAPNVATLDTMFQSQDGWYNDDFYNTQFRILQSRTLAKRTLDGMKLWDAPRLGNGPEPKSAVSFVGLLKGAASGAVHLVKMPFEKEAPAVAAKVPTSELGETSAQSNRIDDFLGGLAVVPVRNSRIVELRYSSTDPEFAAQAANALAKAYIEQNTEFKLNATKDAAGWLGDQLKEQRDALQASERALEDFKQRNGAVSITDSASNIVVARLSELNASLTKAKTERMNKEAQYKQLQSIQGTDAIDSFPAVLANSYIQKLKGELADLQRKQAQISERYGERHPEWAKARSEVETADAKLRIEIKKVVDSMEAEYRAAMTEEQSLQAALNSQKSEAMSLSSKGVGYSVLQREADSNKQLYQSLLQRTKETDMSSGRRATNVRVVDQAETPRSPVSPNVQREIMISFGTSLILAIAVAFGIEHFDNRIKTPQEMKALLGVPFLGMVPVVPKSPAPDPLLHGDVPANFAEALKSVRTNVLFSSTEDGMRSLVITSAGPGEGKSLVASNLAVALSQTGQRVLLVDADMRRPRVHEIFNVSQEPGLSNILTGHSAPNQALRKSQVPGLWLLAAGVIPPNPAELLGSQRFEDFLSSLGSHFDWVVIDTPPVMVVADSSIVANQASGVVFVVAADKASRQSAQAAVEQLHSSEATILGSVLNRVDIVKNPYYYSAYYRKDYARYYVKNAS
jgi:capsular exopolysaccharide synthesis family protein